MNIIEVILLALVQGFTEFIPVSSSGHLVVIEKILKLPQSTAFDMVLHGGTLLSLFVFYKTRIKDFVLRKSKNEISLKNIIIISLPILIVGGVITIINKVSNDSADNIIKNSYLIIFNLLLGGVIFIYIDYFYKNKNKKAAELTTRNAILIGILQSLSSLRGSSRSGWTITGGIFSGLSQKEALNLSFFVGIPVTFIAFIFEMATLALDYNLDVPIYYLIVGFLFSFVSGLLSIKLMLGIINKIGLKYFGFYRIILALILFLILL